jgi:hypothetical protein
LTPTTAFFQKNYTGTRPTRQAKMSTITVKFKTINAGNFELTVDKDVCIHVILIEIGCGGFPEAVY